MAADDSCVSAVSGAVIDSFRVTLLRCTMQRHDAVNASFFQTLLAAQVWRKEEHSS